MWKIRIKYSFNGKQVYIDDIDYRWNIYKK
jgi:hypothetical protein